MIKHPLFSNKKNKINDQFDKIKPDPRDSDVDSHGYGPYGSSPKIPPASELFARDFKVENRDCAFPVGGEKLEGVNRD
jgi:hypothetical protein